MCPRSSSTLPRTQHPWVRQLVGVRALGGCTSNCAQNNCTQMSQETFEKEHSISFRKKMLSVEVFCSPPVGTSRSVCRKCRNVHNWPVRVLPHPIMDPPEAGGLDVSGKPVTFNKLMQRTMFIFCLIKGWMPIVLASAF